MPRLSVIVPIDNCAAHLDKCLDSLIHQTVEDFEVILVDNASDDGSAEIAKKYVDEYNDFYYVRREKTGRAELLNSVLDDLNGDYVFFCDPDGYITDETVEALTVVIDANKDRKIDVIHFRLWRYGDHYVPEFDVAGDVLAALPSVDPTERSLIRCPELCCKAFRRAFLISHNLRFEPSPFCDAIFTFCACRRARDMAGCPKAVYERYVYDFGTSGKASDRIDGETLDAMLSAGDRVLSEGEEFMLARAGAVEGDESYIQEIRCFFIERLIERFYLNFWSMDEALLKKFADEYSKRAGLLVKEKLNYLKDRYKHLALPYIFMTHADALRAPAFSLLLDVRSAADGRDAVRSLYAQTLPFFELFVKQSMADDPDFPAQFRDCPNVRVIPDAEFYAGARAGANAAIVISVRDGEYMDRNVLKETALSRVPGFLKPMMFTRARKQLSLSKTLKNKGLSG